VKITFRAASITRSSMFPADSDWTNRMSVADVPPTLKTSPPFVIRMSPSGLGQTLPLIRWSPWYGESHRYAILPPGCRSSR